MWLKQNVALLYISCLSVYDEHIQLLFSYPSDISDINLLEPDVLYIGLAYRYTPNVAFYIFFQQI
jgi:hypothetical protein